MSMNYKEKIKQEYLDLKMEQNGGKKKNTVGKLTEALMSLKEGESPINIDLCGYKPSFKRKSDNGPKGESGKYYRLGFSKKF